MDPSRSPATGGRDADRIDTRVPSPFLPLLETSPPTVDTHDQSASSPIPIPVASAASDQPFISSPRPRDTVPSPVLGRSNSLKTSRSSIKHAVETRAYAQTTLGSNPSTSIPPRPTTSSALPISVTTTFTIPNVTTTPAPSCPRDLLELGDSLTSATSSPRLFTPVASPFRPESENLDAIEPLSSPSLHHTHRQAPKETRLAEVDVDPVSGRKIVNHYEIISELGRGVHGKVKLGRDLHSGKFVAIKIVDRVSKRKRLGRTGDQEMKIKREIAILKKARHPNIVGLLEVIDDPLKKKVYIILEHAELGEVEWRTRGEPEVCYVEYRKNQRESDGIFNNEMEDRYDQYILDTAHRHIEHQERREWEEAQQRLQEGRASDVGPWSLEHGNESDVEPQSPARGRYAPTVKPLRGETAAAPSYSGQAGSMPPPSIPQPAVATNHRLSNARQPFDALSTAEVQASLRGDLQGNMFGTYGTQSPQEHPSSAFDSFVSSRNEYLADRVPEHYSYVPTMSLSDIRRAIRDTMLGLEYLHYQGVVHRDIKPANLLQTRDHRVKISDFGVSYLGKATGDHVEDPSDTEDQDFDEALELAKTVGTPAFYAPELCRLDMLEENPAPVTNQIDIWAVGVTLYCLVYGRVPFHHDNTFALMRLIAERDVYIPNRRLRAVDIPREPHELVQSPQSQSRQLLDPDKRAPHELEYEEVSDELRDLLQRLLTKDPRSRITLTEVKHHPWLLAGIPDPSKWLDESDPIVLTQGKPIEISQEDVDVAVIPYGISERAKNIAYRVKRKVVDVFGYGKGTSRRRAKSSAAGTGRSSNASSSSTISQDGMRIEGQRKTSRPDEALISALRVREHDHPLSRSVTASPEPDESEQDLLDEFSSARPDVLERGISATGSVRTIRQRDVAFLSNPGAATAPAFPSTPDTLERPPNTSDGILGGASGKHIFGTQSRRLGADDRAQLMANAFLQSNHESRHSRPVVAIDETNAAGLVHVPTATRATDGFSSPLPSAASSRAPSATGLSDIARLAEKHETVSRRSSLSSMSSRGRSAFGSRFLPHSTHASQASDLSHDGHSARKVSHPQLDIDIVAKAKEEQLRRLIQEERQHQATASAAPSPVSSAPCPPSPDDLDFNKYQNELLSHAEHAAIEPTTLTIVPGASTTTYDSDEQYPPTMSQSTSNPSIPSAISANSSIGNDEMALFGAHSTRKAAAWHSSQAQAEQPQFRELSPHYEEGPLIIGQDDEYSSDEEFLEMGGRKPPAPKSRGRDTTQVHSPISAPLRLSIDISPKRVLENNTQTHQ